VSTPRLAVEPTDTDAESPSRCGAPSAHGGLGKERRPKAWRAIWCFERCHKVEEAPLRAAIADSAAELGGSFSCFKKAKKFEEILPRMPEPYALITDGREARPCVQALCGGCGAMPTLMVVLSEKPKYASRLTLWARGLPQEGFDAPVFVIQDARELAPILRASELPIVEQPGAPQLLPALRLPAAPARGAIAPTAASPAAVASSSRAIISTSPAAAATATRRSSMACGDATRTSPAPLAALGVQAPWPSVCVLAPFLFQKCAEGVEPEILSVLAAALPASVGAGALEDLLARSAPEFYEE